MDLNTDLMQLKQPPSSDEAEEAVIGALLIDNNVWDSIDEIITGSDFYRQAYRSIFNAISSLAAKFEPFDYITVCDVLKQNNELEVIGGENYLIDIVERTLSSANVVVYAKLVRDKSVLRQLIKAGNHIVEMGYDPGQEETHHLLDRAEQTIFNIAEGINNQKDDGFADINHIVKDTYLEIEKRAKSGSSITGLSSGWKDYDELTSGLHDSDLIVVAARPSMGKTTFCLNIAAHIAVKDKKNVAFFSLEMPREQLMMRLFSAIGKIPLNNIRSGKLSNSDLEKMKLAISTIKDSPLHINDAPSLTPTELRAKCRRLVKQHGKLSLVVIDYLQLMEVHGKFDSKANSVAEISRALKLLAKEFQCPVIVLSQLNRNLEQRSNKRPIMSDLRDSGAIEQDADVITFIYRDAVYASDDEPAAKENRTTEIIVGKQRNGPVDKVKLNFMGELCQFVDYFPEQNIPFQ